METFKKEIENGFVIVDFYAPWCADCVRIEPVINELSKEYKIYKVNIDEYKNIADEHSIRRIPTLVFYKNGEEVGTRLVEPKSKQEILNEIDKIK